MNKTVELELNGKRYMVRFVPAGALVRVMTKSGWRSLAGYGRAFRAAEMAAVIAAATKQAAAEI